MYRYGHLWVVGAAIFGFIALASTYPAISAQEGIESTPGVDGSSSVLYEADWSDGIGDWEIPLDWDTSDGQLIHSGNESSWAIVPFTPETDDYAIEAEMRVVRADGIYGFGLVASANDEGGYFGGYWQGNDLDQNKTVFVSDCTQAYCAFPAGNNEIGQRFTMDDEWHTYRLEAQGTRVRLFLDDRLVASMDDTQFVDGGAVGLNASQAQLVVRSFKVLSLP